MSPRTGLRDLVLLAMAAVAGYWLPTLALGWSARPVLLNLGPNDGDYLKGFRPEWERDVRTRFHWTTPAAEVQLPVSLTGPGHVLRMRIRRHFIEPAEVRLETAGQVVGRFSIAADTRIPYRTIEYPLPDLERDGAFTLSIHAPSENPRPLGIAIDWLEVERRSPEARVELLPRTRWLLALVALLALAIPRAAGLRPLAACVHAMVVLAMASIGAGWDVLALERIVREGWLTYAAVAGFALAVLLAWRLARGVNPAVTGTLALLVMVALALRLVLLLHPQFYYPDVKVHAIFAWQMVRKGLPDFLRDFTASQYQYSLGLQLENGHWYAFPYPPAFYVLSWPLIRLLGYRPEVAISLLAAAVNSLETLAVFAIARRLGQPVRIALAAAAALPVLPIFLARLGLAYFPAITGHAFDVLVILYLICNLRSLSRIRVVITLAALLAASFLAYTQSLLNFGILLTLFLLFDLLRDRTPGARSRQLGLVSAGVLAGVLALVCFYGRYIPIFIGMRQGIPMPEERVLLEKPQPAQTQEPVVPDDDDPYSGPDFNPLRGLRKAASRLYIFYGVFAVAVVVGLVLVLRAAPGASGRLVAAWGLTYVVLNLASGGLPGPNLVRYNKDLEIVAPLCCLALAMVWERLDRRSRWLGAAYALSFWGFGVGRLIQHLTEKFVLER